MNLIGKPRKFIFFLLIAFTSVNTVLLAGGKPEGTVPDKVPVDHLTGISLWIANMHNDERVLFSILVTLLMGVVGLSIGFVTDLFLKLFGLDVSKINHLE